MTIFDKNTIDKIRSVLNHEIPNVEIIGLDLSIAEQENMLRMIANDGYTTDMTNDDVYDLGMKIFEAQIICKGKNSKLCAKLANSVTTNDSQCVIEFSKYFIEAIERI